MEKAPQNSVRPRPLLWKEASFHPGFPGEKMSTGEIIRKEKVFTLLGRLGGKAPQRPPYRQVSGDTEGHSPRKDPRGKMESNGDGG